MIEEIWKDVDGFDGMYKISSFGRVWSNSQCSRGRKLIYGSVDNSQGYRYVKLWKGGKKHKRYIHRLIASHFIPNPYNKPQVDHINTDRLDNRIENLRWVTKKENANNPLTRFHNSNAKKGHHITPINAIRSVKIKIAKVNIDGQIVTIYESISDAAKENGLNQSYLSVKIKEGVFYKGFKWIKYDRTREQGMVSK